MKKNKFIVLELVKKNFLAHMWVTKPPTCVFGTLPLLGGQS